MRKEIVELAPIETMFDPLGYFKGVPLRTLQEAAGILVSWSHQVLVSDAPLKTLEELYGFDLTQMKGEAFSDEGIHYNPVGPDHYPICKIINLKTKRRIWIYLYSCIAIEVKPNKFFMTRID